MHQHPRPSPRVASPASSPRMNPTRTNNARDEVNSIHSRPPSEGSAQYDAEEGPVPNEGPGNGMTEPSRDSHKKLDKIIQNFHTKAAIVILQSRMSMPVLMTKEQTRKVNRWFQIETDDTDAFRDELKVWRTCGAFENRPPPLVVETYLDTSDLTSNQSLVMVDEDGKRWDVTEALNASAGGNAGGTSDRKPRTKVVLERWRIELLAGPDVPVHDFGATLPTTYKKSIVFFRSLYATTKFVPAWRFIRNLAKSGTKSALRVKCRVFSAEDAQPSDLEALTCSLQDGDGPVVTTFSLGETDSPAGKFHAELCYRNDCNFRVDDAESLLSSRFMGVDERYFRPSLDIGSRARRETSKTVEIGSLPTSKAAEQDLEPTQAYGSLSTFHGNAPPLGSSPLSALRAAKNMGSDTESPPVSSSPVARPGQTPRSLSGRPLEGIAMARRPSLSFQPFKAGSLSASPVPGSTAMNPAEMHSPQSPHSLPRLSGVSALAQARNRSSLTAGMPATLRGVPVVPENAIASSASSSPKPAPISRYSSSFSHRRGKLSSGGTSKGDDDQGSSGKQSLSSSVQPGSGTLAEGGGSSGSLQTDDDNISDFLKLLDSKKTLQSFELPRAGETSAKRTNAQLSRFQSMRESNNVLTDSMTSSTLLHRSSTSSSRQLSGVPQMIAATSISTSSSPGKPVSPHTPHTPAVPSRLSANSIAEYNHPQRSSNRARVLSESHPEDVVNDEGNAALGTTAIDIPTSPRPRPYYSHTRRSSSVAQQHRSIIGDDDIGDMPFSANRSISLGADDREAPSLSSLLGRGQTAETIQDSNPRQGVLQPAIELDESPETSVRRLSASQERGETRPVRGQIPGYVSSPYKPRIGRSAGRGLTPPQTGSYSSLPTDKGSGSGHSDRPGSRYSFTRPTGNYETEDEPLLFDMSEIGRDQSRRSLEDTSLGVASSSVHEKAMNETSRSGDSGSSNHRGSRRGW